MQSYGSKYELIMAIKTNYQKYINEFRDIPNDLKDKRIAHQLKIFHTNLAGSLRY